MTRKCIIHIGIPKTGSSSIQRTLKKMENERVLYIPFLSSNHGRNICVSFGSEKQQQRFFREIGSVQSEINEYITSTKKTLNESFAKEKYSAFIISGEAIINLEKEGLVKLKEYINTYNIEVEIVGYIREPYGFMVSAYQQMFKRINIIPKLESYYPRYFIKLQKFDEVFGRENVTFWKFENKYFPKGDVVLDFCQKLDIPMDSQKTIRVNESLSKEAVGLLYIYRKYGPEYGVGPTVIRNNNRIINALSKIGNQKFKLSPSMVMPILNANYDDILWMEKRLGESLVGEEVESDDDIKNEEELLEIGMESVHLLKEIVNIEHFPKNISTNSYQEVVNIIDTLTNTNRD